VDKTRTIDRAIIRLRREENHRVRKDTFYADVIIFVRPASAASGVLIFQSQILMTAWDDDAQFLF